MNNPFIKWNLGSVASAFCAVPSPIHLPEPLFARMRFERANRLEFKAGEGTEVSFRSQRVLHEIRSRSLAAGWSHWTLPLVRVQRSEQDHEVRVDFMFPATVLEVPSAIPLLLDRAVLEQIYKVADDQARADLLDNLVLDSSFGKYLVRQAPGFIEDDAVINVVKFLVPSGFWLCCRLYKNARGNSYLHATFAEPIPREKALLKAPRVHFVPLSGSYRLQPIQSPDDADANEAGRLSLSASPIVIAWSQYHRLVAAERKRLFDQRAALPLLYHAPHPEEATFRVSLRNWPAARGTWCQEDLLPGTDKTQSISVTLKANEADSEDDAVKAVIEKFSYEGDAWISTSGAVPPERGVILATEASDRADERRKASVERLHAGEVALPKLLDILNDPSLALRARPCGTVGDHNALNLRQREVVERALANDSVMAVQGPPGTGKTKVIVEIVRRLFLARPNNQPLRILISSTQNQAVWNAVTRLQGQGVLIHLNLSEEAERRAKSEGLLEDLAHPVSDIQEKLDFKVHSDLDLSRTQLCLESEEKLAQSLQATCVGPEETLNWLAGLMTEWQANPLAEMISSWGQASVLCEELGAALKALQPIPGADAPLPDAAADLRQLLRTSDPHADSQPVADHLQQHLAALETAFGPAFVEEFREVLKEHRRAVRDENASSAQARWERLGQLLAETEAARRPLPQAELLPDILRRTNAWRARSVEELADLRARLRATRSGAILDWQRALRQDPIIWREICQRYSQVVGATTQMASTTAGPGEIDWYDYVIVDEAGRSNLFDLLIPMTLGRRILLVGDQQQLPPFIEDTLLARGAQADVARVRELQAKLASQTLFRELYDRLPEDNRMMLNVQYRMHPVIGDAISGAFYEGQLDSGPEDRSSPSYQDWLITKQPRWDLYGNSPLVWVESGSGQISRAKHQNEREVAIVQDLVRQALAAQPAERVVQDERFLGIISFYASQVRLIEEAIAALPNAKSRIQVGTVDSFQGKEFPLIILSCCRHDPIAGAVGFLTLSNRWNVGLSRAQCQLIIVGSAATFLHSDSSRGSHPVRDFVAAAGPNLVRAEPL